MIRGAALIALLASAAPLDAFAFELMRTNQGATLHWLELPPEYGAEFTLLDPAGERFAAGCRRALDRFGAAEGTIAEARWSGPHAAPRIGDGRSTIFSATVWDPAFGDADRTVAHTELRFDARTGTIAEADLVLNGETFRFGDGEPDHYDLESVVLHEAGHLFGLAHSCGEPGTAFPSCFSLPESERERILGAVMAPGLAPTVRRRDLAADDLAGLAALYPGARTGAAVTISGLERPCPGDRLEIEGALPASLAIELRWADGSTGAAVVEEGSIPVSALEPERGTVDLVAREVGGTRRAIVVGAERPAPEGCTPPPPPIDEDSGCSCRGARSMDPRSWARGWVLAAIGWLLGRRRR